jgi:hypothetical protein
LTVGDVNCPHCGEVVRGVGAEPRVSTAPAAVPPPVVVAREPSAETVTVPAPRPAPAVRMPPFRHLVAIGLVAGLLVAVGLLSLELVGPGPALDPGDVDLQEQEFDDLGFVISSPVGWSVRRGRVERLQGVTFIDATEAGQRRGFRVVLDKLSLREVNRHLASLVRNRDYDRISADSGVEVGGQPALEHVYTQGGLRFEQWYVERPGGSYRIEFWAPMDATEQASTVDAQILDTFEVR